MKKPFRNTSCLLIFALPMAALSQHNVLLPQPQQVKYGSGKLHLSQAEIFLPANAAPEDSFAAQQLSSCLRERSGQQLAITHDSGHTPEIALIRTGAVDALPQPNEKPGPDSREAYSIAISEHGGQITAKSSAGLFYGVQTLCQLAEADGTVPEVHIKDWPAVAYHGTMVDMSEGPLPTEDEIKRQIDFLARWKANQYYFYSETSIELDGYPLLNPGARFSKEQIRQIVAYGRERHIDVIPCLELYGHLHDMFRIEKYAALADFPHGGEFKAGDPQVMKLLADWAEQFAELFPSPFVHIGFDETWEIQKAAQTANTTAKDLFIRQLQDVSQLFHKHGKTVMAWADIMVKYPEIVSSLPPGTIAVAWYYDPAPDPHYRRWLGPLVQHDVPHFVAPGVNSWDEIFPDFPLTFENIDTFLAAGRESKALGIMNTIWTDDAQMLMRLSWPGIAYGAIAAWQQGPVDRATFFSNYARQMYPPAIANEIGQAIENQAESETHLQNAIGHDTMDQLWADPFAPQNLQKYLTHQEGLRQSRILAEEAEEHLFRAATLSHGTEDLNDLLFASQLLDYAGLKFLYASEISQRWKALGPHPDPEKLNGDFLGAVAWQQHGKIADLMDAITELRPRYEQAWLREYSPFRMRSALGRWDAEYEYWRRLQANLQTFARTYRQGQALPDFSAFAPRQ